MCLTNNAFLKLLLSLRVGEKDFFDIIVTVPDTIYGREDTDACLWCADAVLEALPIWFEDLLADLDLEKC